MKTFIKSFKYVSIQEKNKLINFHNRGSEDEEYGTKLIDFARKLEERSKITEEELNKILVLSIEYPIDIAISFLK
jgi:hypothetical protein